MSNKEISTQWWDRNGTGVCQNKFNNSSRGRFPVFPKPARHLALESHSRASQMRGPLVYGKSAWGKGQPWQDGNKQANSLCWAPNPTFCFPYNLPDDKLTRRLLLINFECSLRMVHGEEQKIPTKLQTRFSPLASALVSEVNTTWLPQIRWGFVRAMFCTIYVRKGGASPIVSQFRGPRTTSFGVALSLLRTGWN